MNGLLHVDGADTTGLWRVIFAHTQSVPATAQILRELTDAARRGR